MYYRWFVIYGSLFRAVISKYTLNKNSPRSEAEIEKEKKTKKNRIQNSCLHTGL